MSRKKDIGPLSCTIDNFEDRFAKISFLSGNCIPETLLIAKKYLPKNAKIGDTFNIKFCTNNELKFENNNLAKNILDEIIGNSK